MQLLIAVVVALVAMQVPSREAEVRSILDAQVSAWNRGDIAGYMAGYWRSEQTVFLSGGTKTLGFDEVASRYTARYRTREDMGTLTFEELEVRFVGPATAVVHGVWRLRRMSDEPWGRFTLIVEKKKEGWRITHDHTSSGE